MKKNDVRTRIIAALDKLGPSSPRQILDKVGGAESKCSYHLNAMAKLGLLKAAGKSSSRVYALPEQQLPASSMASSVKPQAAANAEVIAARTADGGIVIFRPKALSVPTFIDARFVPALTELLKAA